MRVGYAYDGEEFCLVNKVCRLSRTKTKEFERGRIVLGRSASEISKRVQVAEF